MEQHYKFFKKDYDKNGFNLAGGLCFVEFIHDCEDNFNNKFSPFFANHLYGNDSTMVLIKNCLESDSKYDYGMDLIDGNIDLDINLEIEESSKRKTVFAIGSAHDEDEPLFLIRDDSVSNEIIILKYISENDDEDIETKIPTDTNLIKIEK